MDQQNWYDEGRQERFGNTDTPKRKKRTVSFATLIVCMLLTAMVGGAFGGIIMQGGQAQSQSPVSETTLQAQTTPTPVQNAQNTSQPVSNLPSRNTSMNESGPYTKSEVIALAAPSIVGIDISANVSTGIRGQTAIATGSGSGIIISSDGYIITNDHVVAGAETIKVYLYDDTEYDATLIATDDKTDLAVIKIEAQGLTPAVMGDSDTLIVGEDVIAIGNPLGELRGTATSGMISGLSRTITIENKEMTLLQTDAAVNPGNSGGGLFNSNGELIGVINAKVASEETEGLGFAIPINSAKVVVADLIDLGYVSGRAYLGVYLKEVAVTISGGVDGNSNRSGNYLDGLFGLYGSGYSNIETRVQVNQVILGSAAETAGIQAGDLILQVNGKEIYSQVELSNAIREYNAGDVATIRVQRGTQEFDLSVTFGEYIPE